MSNLNNIKANIDAAIDAGLGIGGILAVNHNNVLTETLFAAGRYTGFFYTASGDLSGLAPTGFFLWNGNDPSSLVPFVVRAAQLNIDLGDFGDVLALLSAGDIITFKDVEGRFFQLAYQSHVAGVDGGANNIYDITVTGVASNSNYIYGPAETQTAGLGIISASAAGGGGQVNTLQDGQAITIDAADPVNPIVDLGGTIDDFVNIDITDPLDNGHGLEITGTDGSGNNVTHNVACESIEMEVADVTGDLQSNGTLNAQGDFAFVGLSNVSGNDKAGRVQTEHASEKLLLEYQDTTAVGFPKTGIEFFSDELRIITPAIDAATAVVGQVLTLINVSGEMEFANAAAGTGLEAIDEGNGIGWRLIGKPAANYGNIGLNAIDLSESAGASVVFGATGDLSAIGGGSNNEASGAQSTIGGGTANTALGGGATVGGGTNNEAAQTNAFVGGGVNNEAQEQQGVVAGGADNIAVERYAAIGGGEANNAGGRHSAIPGGLFNFAPSFGELSGGINGTTYVPGSALAFVATDRVFNIGNGINFFTPSDAFTILKNGTITAPSLTPALITAAGNPALITKEYGDANYLGGGGNTIYTGNDSLTGIRTVDLNSFQLNFDDAGNAVVMNSGRLGVKTEVFGGTRLGDSDLQASTIDLTALNFKDAGQLTALSMFFTAIGGSDGYVTTMKNFVDDVNVISIAGVGAAVYNAALREVEATLGLRNDFTGGQFRVFDTFNNDYDSATPVAVAQGWVAIHGGGATGKQIGLWRYDGITYDPIFTTGATDKIVTFDVPPKSNADAVAADDLVRFSQLGGGAGTNLGWNGPTREVTSDTGTNAVIDIAGDIIGSNYGVILDDDAVITPTSLGTLTVSATSKVVVHRTGKSNSVNAIIKQLNGTLAAATFAIQFQVGAGTPFVAVPGWTLTDTRGHAVIVAGGPVLPLGVTVYAKIAGANIIELRASDNATGAPFDFNGTTWTNATVSLSCVF